MTKRGKAEKMAARNARLSAALRENLKRRKAQARARRREIGNGGEAPAPEPDKGSADREESQCACQVPPGSGTPVRARW
jgi:hypothetical protein